MTEVMRLISHLTLNIEWIPGMKTKPFSCAYANIMCVKCQKKDVCVLGGLGEDMINAVNPGSKCSTNWCTVQNTFAVPFAEMAPPAVSNQKKQNKWFRLQVSCPHEEMRKFVSHNTLITAFKHKIGQWWHSPSVWSGLLCTYEKKAVMFI